MQSEKVSITIDVTKIPKANIVERRFTNNAGHEVAVKELKLDIVPVKEPKLIKEGDTWQMIKTHFVAIQQTKEEREKKQKSVIIGDGITFRQKQEDQPAPASEVEGEEINAEDIPF